MDENKCVCVCVSRMANGKCVDVLDAVEAVDAADGAVDGARCV